MAGTLRIQQRFFTSQNSLISLCFALPNTVLRKLILPGLCFDEALFSNPESQIRVIG